jgi:hypothetical protein
MNKLRKELEELLIREGIDTTYSLTFDELVDNIMTIFIKSKP